MDTIVAPYAETTIPIYAQAVTSPRYRLLSCVECAETFLERQGDMFYRVGNKDLPEEAHVNEVGGIETRCGNCQQRYTVYFSLEKMERSDYTPDPLLYQRPQTIFIASEPTKRMRDSYCLECHHAYLTLSDRISMISDGVMMLDHLSGLGPMQVRCKFKGCKQRWELLV